MDRTGAAPALTEREWGAGVLLCKVTCYSGGTDRGLSEGDLQAHGEGGRVAGNVTKAQKTWRREGRLSPESEFPLFLGPERRGRANGDRPALSPGSWASRILAGR